MTPSGPKNIRLTILGSGLEANVPDDFECFFNDGILIDRRNHKPMEMDAYSLYLALKALEQNHSIDYKPYRKKILDSILQRYHACGEFWNHSHWTSSSREVHLRFTSWAIRLLIEAFRDNLFNDPEIIISALRKQISFHERLQSNTLWFLHDSLETDTYNGSYPQNLQSNEVFGSSINNTMTLNTHLDTLTTLLLALRVIKFVPKNNHDEFYNNVKSGLETLNYIFFSTFQSSSRFFQDLDHVIRKGVLKFSGSSNLLSFPVIFIYSLYYRTIRMSLRERSPIYQFEDGYVERDMGLLGMNFDYHIVNTWDLAKLASMMEKENLDPILSEKLWESAHRALDYAFSDDFLPFLYRTIRTKSSAVQLCETLYLFFQKDLLLEGGWINRYMQLRKKLAPTPALLGYDPIILDAMPASEDSITLRNYLNPSETDVLILPANQLLVINFSSSPKVLSNESVKQWNVKPLVGNFSKDNDGWLLHPESTVLLNSP